mmetsp:Transcript_21466/g.61525  ORF Transcript_21466/g.61525 Transcript_21466/m.61525 type:complete len:209 (-) Transcript_21466:411-1037(-)
MVRILDWHGGILCSRWQPPKAQSIRSTDPTRAAVCVGQAVPHLPKPDGGRDPAVLARGRHLRSRRFLLLQFGNADGICQRDWERHVRYQRPCRRHRRPRDQHVREGRDGRRVLVDQRAGIRSGHPGQLLRPAGERPHHVSECRLSRTAAVESHAANYQQRGRSVVGRGELCAIRRWGRCRRPIVAHDLQAAQGDGGGVVGRAQQGVWR